MNLKRLERSKRKVTVKKEPNGRCINQTYYVHPVTGYHRVKYYHVTKGWRDRRA